MIEIKIQCATVEAAIMMLARLRDTDNPPAVPAATAPDSAEQKRGPGRPPKPPVVMPPDPTVTAASVSAAPADKPSDAKPPAAASGVEYAAVAKAITEGVQVSKAKVVEALGKFGAKTGKDLKPEAYGDFLEALADALKPAEDLA
jgi:hypothetical protein